MTRRVPSLVPGVDIFSLPLTTVEGFVLSRVDGGVSVEDISMMSGIDQTKLITILERLRELGAVNLPWMGERGKAAQRAPVAAVRPPSSRQVDAHFALGEGRYDAAELDAESDLSIEARRRILNALHAIEHRNHYDVLGVDRRSDKKQIKDAYFELSKLFHPDAYFGKQLGGFKQKMEVVFKRLTEAYDVLGRAKKRTEYDQYLATTEQTRRASRTLDSLKLGTTEAQALADLSRGQRERAASPAPRANSAPLEIPATPPPPRVPISTAERRARVRDRLRRGLKTHSSQMPPPPSAPPAPEQDSAQRRRSVIDGLKTTIQASNAVTNTPDAQVQKLLKRAKDAEGAGDLLLAASQLQQALAVDPQRSELLTEYDRVSKLVARNLADNYEKQALYEEKTSNWQAAARSWARVAEGRGDDARAASRAADALLKAGGDLHQAQRHAQRAVQLDAKSVANLTILARVYLAAGLKLNALRELEKAAQLAPRDELVNNLLREAR